MSNKVYAGLIGGLLASIAVVAVILQHLKEINAALLYITYGLAALAALALLYLLYLAWHNIRSRHLDRKYKHVEIENMHKQQEHLEWRETQQLNNTREIELERIRLEQMKAQLEHERLMAIARWQTQQTTIPAGHLLYIREESGNHTTIQAPAVQQLLRGPVQVEELPFVAPVAPSFRDMAHLVTAEGMPLCYTQDGPAFGTVDDLLSMCITGKPGRGKTTALMYYVCILLRAGAVVYVWDPHGAMGALAVLNNRRLPGMPETARIVYLDQKDDIVNSVPVLHRQLKERDDLYRECKRLGKPFIMHPLLLLADELPVLADYDEQVEQEYKSINKARARDDDDLLPVPSLITLIRKFVLEARKWRGFFIGSGQSIDAEILPTKVTDALNSRIIFFNSDRKARMSGLETDAIKNLLPLVRRAGSGVMIFDCARFDEPVIGAIPNVEMSDMLAFLGVTQQAPIVLDMPPLPGRTVGESWRVDTEPAETVIEARPPSRQDGNLSTQKSTSQRNTGELETPPGLPVAHAGESPNTRPNYPLMNETQKTQFIALYPLQGTEKALDQIKGCSHSHRMHARAIIEEYKLERKRIK